MGLGKLAKLNVHIHYEPAVPLLNIQEKNLYMDQKKSVVMFIATSVHNSKKLETSQIMDKLYSHTIACDIARKMNELQLHMTILMSISIKC